MEPKYWLALKGNVVVNTIYGDEDFILNHADQTFQYEEFDPNIAGSPGIGWSWVQGLNSYVPPVDPT